LTRKVAGMSESTTSLAGSASAVFTRRSVAILVALVAVHWGFLILEGRPAWCKHGFGIWSNAWTHCTSQNFLDPYSFSHALHGIIFYWALTLLWPKSPREWRLIAAIAIEIGWEVLENSPWVVERYRQQTASLDYTGDSILNSIGDVLWTVVGFYFAARVSWKVALFVFVVVEVVLLFVIRDNLTLNVLMLFVPLDSIQQWQLKGG
jgi:hypothetical protein